MTENLRRLQLDSLGNWVLGHTFFKGMSRLLTVYFILNSQLGTRNSQLPKGCPTLTLMLLFFLFSEFNIVFLSTSNPKLQTPNGRTHRFPPTLFFFPIIYPYKILDRPIISFFRISRKITCRKFLSFPMVLDTLTTYPFFRTGISAVAIFFIFICVTFHNTVLLFLYIILKNLYFVKKKFEKKYKYVIIKYMKMLEVCYPNFNSTFSIVKRHRNLNIAVYRKIVKRNY